MVSVGRIRGTMIRAQRLPNVVIGGAPRSGTTYLCELLDKHPDVHVARPFIPEPKVCLTPAPDGDAGFRERYAALFASAPGRAVLVEKTSYYLENNEARGRLTRLLPEARFVFILREPVSRAYSNWLWSRKNGLETLPFEQAIELEGRRPSPLPPEQSYVRPFDYMTRGRYGTLAETWIGAVGRDRVAFYVFESVLDGPEDFVSDLQRFVGVKPLPWSKLATSRVNANEPDAAGLDPALAEILRKRIAPEIRRFTRVTGVDVSVWAY
jgi:hypothetical protein